MNAVGRHLSEIDTEEAPESGLVAYARLDRSRSLVRAALDQLCQQAASADVPLTDHSMKVLIAMVGTLLESHLEFELKALKSMNFPVMSELTERHRAILGEFRDLAQCKVSSTETTRVVAAALAVRNGLYHYFGWIDAFFCRPG